MAILRNCLINWVKLDPKKPTKNYNEDGFQWELQVVVTDPAQLQEFKDLKIAIKLLREKTESEDEIGEPILNEAGEKQYISSLRKASTKSDGTPADPVTVVDGNRKDVDPTTIGNGSIANLKIFQVEYEKKKVKKGEDPKGMFTMLTGVQLIKHIVYTPTGGEDFDICTTERIVNIPKDTEGDSTKVSDSNNDDF
jgi:hypothetical protein